MFVLFWTDALIFLLVGVTVVLALVMRRRADVRTAWRHVLHDRLAMASAIVLAAYLLVALADSIHFRPRLPDNGDGPRYGPQVLSLLDLSLTALRERVEKTYSAPFATHAFAKETIENERGVQSRAYPRLRYGGAHLADPEQDWAKDVATRVLRALLKVALVWLGLAAVWITWLARQSRQPMSTMLYAVLAGRTPLPWHVALVTLAMLLVAASLLIDVAPFYHLLGTDKVGQDVLYQALKSVRTGIVIGTLTTLVMLPFAIALGIMAGYFGGWVDDLVQYIYTTLNSIPGILLIAASVLMLQVHMATHADHYANLEVRADLRLLWLCIILGVMNWTGLCRLLRGEALKLREADYILAAQILGVPHWRILFRHVLPNVMHIVMISVVLDFSGLVLAEAVLSYVNIGVDPTMNSWGGMINSARLELAREPVVWWSLVAAFLFMFVLVLAANLFADAVRDAFDPRLRGTRDKSALGAQT